MSKKKLAIIISVVVCILAAATVLFFVLKKRGINKGNGKLVYVESVKSLTGVSVGNSSRYMGVVESQESKGVQKDSGKSIKEVFVKEGDYVKKGDKLFSYDTSEMEMNLEQLNIERTGIQNSVNSLYNSLNDYNTQRSTATDEDDILSYTSQINSTTTSIKEEEYNLSAKDLAIKKQKEAIEKAVVTSPMNGIIKKIGAYSTSSDSGESMSDEFEEEDDMSIDNADDSTSNSGFITIIAEGDYRIKGITDETNIYAFTSGTKVILRSRVDESVTWKGSVAKVDMEPKQNNSDYYGDSGESASKYNFYVNPESTDDMILGQHLYIELDYGQNDKKDGLYLPSYLLVQEEENFFVWKRGENDLIVKAQVTVGEYDEAADSYEITDGLTLDDYIAYPTEDIQEGNPTTTNIEDVDDPGMNEESEEMYDDVYPATPGTPTDAGDGEEFENIDDGDVIDIPDAPDESMDDSMDDEAIEDDSIDNISDDGMDDLDEEFEEPFDDSFDDAE